MKSICKLRLFVGLQAVIIADSISTSFCGKFSSLSGPSFLIYPFSVACFIPTALLKENSTTNRYALLTLVVNTVVIGDYAKPNIGIVVPGIFAKGKYNGTNIDLLSYFNGG